MTSSRLATAFVLSAVVGTVVLQSAIAATATAQQVPLPRPRPTSVAATSPASNPAAASSVRAAPIAPLAAAIPAVSASDLAAIKQTIDLLHGGKRGEANDLERTISDPLARKLAEWIILRDDDNGSDFARYNAFVRENPNWPSIGMFRRRAEAMLWQEHADSTTARAFLTATKAGPLTVKGRLALARAYLADGERAIAQREMSLAWRDAMPSDVEEQALGIFREFITHDVDRARMTSRLYANDNEAALRAAQRLGGADLAITQARIAISKKSADAEALLEAVPTSARGDAGYIFARIEWLRRNDQIAEAGQMMLGAPRDPAELSDVDEWWVERRLLARKLLDIGDAKSAFSVVRDAVQPSKENHRVEQAFTTGWIALRFLEDPRTAAEYFARIPQLSQNPIALSRSGYWMGRALEAMNRTDDAHVYYENAARYGTAYYGQLARARLGLGELALTPAPTPSADRRAALANSEILRAAQILYAVNARDLVAPMAADLAERMADVDVLVMLAEIADRSEDARSMNLIGKAALARGLAFGHYAFPTVGIPAYRAIGPEVERAVVFSIVKQESAFNPLDVSSAKALGLMQVTPDAGRFVARKYKVAFDQKRLLHDVVYNLQMGSAELGGVIEDYRGSYILAFAAYNAGSGRVREWLERYGDPRDPRVDPIDWVERIPFSETRNYVQRVLENLQVYRLRFGGGRHLMIEADLRRGAVTN